MPWLSGEDLQNFQLKYLTEERVLAELGVATNKVVLQASSVVTSIVSGLLKNTDFIK